jgi:uncharacterized caspase-like protein
VAGYRPATGSRETPAEATPMASHDLARLREQAGRYHALVVGNEDYRVLPPRANAIVDARLVARTLRDTYGFEVTVLSDAGRYDLLLALNDLRQRLTDRDNLLIYYAGHATRQGDAWLPVDAEPGNPASWISQAAITELLGAMTVRQVLLATDSCYARGGRPGAGAPDGGEEQARQVPIQALASRRSRVLMTSGACDDASPATAGQPTPFTRSLVEILDGNRDALAGQEVFRRVRRRLATLDRPESSQAVRYAPLRDAGHEAGDFFFIRPRRP